MKYQVGDLFLNLNDCETYTGIIIESLQSVGSYCVTWFPHNTAAYCTYHTLLSIESNIINKHWKHYPVKL